MPKNAKTKLAKKKADSLVKSMEDEKARKKKLRENTISAKTEEREKNKPETEQVEKLKKIFLATMHKPAMVTYKDGRTEKHERLGDLLIWAIRKGEITDIKPLPWPPPNDEKKEEA